MARRKRYYRRKKYTTISVMQIGHLAAQYSNLTGQDIGTVANTLVNSLMQGNADPLEIIMEQVNAGLNNVTANPTGVAFRGAFIAFLFAQLRSLVGHKKFFQVGRFRITS